MAQSKKGLRPNRKESLPTNIRLVGSFKCRPETEAIFQKYPPENFQRPPRCRGGACSAGPPIPFNMLWALDLGIILENFSSKTTKRNAL